MSSVKVERLLTIDEAAEFLGISRNGLYIAAREGRVPNYKIGALIRFDQAELRVWLESRRRGPKVVAEP